MCVTAALSVTVEVLIQSKLSHWFMLILVPRKTCLVGLHPSVKHFEYSFISIILCWICSVFTRGVLFRSRNIGLYVCAFNLLQKQVGRIAANLPKLYTILHFCPLPLIIWRYSSKLIDSVQYSVSQLVWPQIQKSKKVKWAFYYFIENEKKYNKIKTWQLKNK